MDKLPLPADININRTDLFRQVESEYVHVPKVIKPAPALTSPEVYLKWYLVYPESRPISAAEVAEAQAFLADEIAQGRLALTHEIGFVIQHRCTGVDILYVCSWRNNNEVWETLYNKSATGRESFQIVRRENTTGTFCVWVIPVVAHEQAAWVRYLQSARDAQAQFAYCQDQLISE